MKLTVFKILKFQPGMSLSRCKHLILLCAWGCGHDLQHFCCIWQKTIPVEPAICVKPRRLILICSKFQKHFCGSVMKVELCIASDNLWASCLVSASWMPHLSLFICGNRVTVIMCHFTFLNCLRGGISCSKSVFMTAFSSALRQAQTACSGLLLRVIHCAGWSYGYYDWWFYFSFHYFSFHTSKSPRLVD